MELAYLGPTKTTIICHLDAGETLGNLGPHDVLVTEYIKVDGADPNYRALLAQDPTLETVIDPNEVKGVKPPPGGTGPEEAAAPTCTFAPNVSGGATVGSALNSTMGIWTGVPDAYAYAWQKDGVDIAGATGASYTTQAADVGGTITSIVTASNAQGSASSPPSNGVGPIA
jgi:hypothetical protein